MIPSSKYENNLAAVENIEQETAPLEPQKLSSSENAIISYFNPDDPSGTSADRSDAFLEHKQNESIEPADGENIADEDEDSSKIRYGTIDLLNEQAKQRQQQQKAAEAGWNKEMKKDFYKRLCVEKLQKSRARSGSPISRKQYLEALDEAECKFKPLLGERTKELAEEIKKQRKFDRIDNMLYEDAKKRLERKKKHEDDVNILC